MFESRTEEIKSFLHTALSSRAGFVEVYRIKPQALPSVSLPFYGLMAQSKATGHSPPYRNLCNRQNSISYPNVTETYG